MSLYLPQLPVQLDPLIADAKRRRRRRLLTVAAALTVAAIGAGALGRWVASGVNATGTTVNSGKQCAANPTYGSACIETFGVHGRVIQIQAWMTEHPYLGGDTWRMDLELYRCDPIGKAKAGCPAATTWHGRTRNGAAQTAHLRQTRSHQYWPTFALPHTFRTHAWLCTELAVHPPNATWRYATGLAHGLRACFSIHK